jgi:cytidyltransferase-like protein
MKYIGLFIGRFQPFHNGHLDALKQIEKILLSRNSESDCEIIIVVGNNQVLDYRHWWTFDQVKAMIEPSLKDFTIPIRIEYVSDLNDPPNYAKYVLEKLQLKRDEIELTVFSGNWDTLKCFPIDWAWRYQLKETPGTKHGTELRLMMAYEIMTARSTGWTKFVPESTVSQVDVDELSRW